MVVCTHNGELRLPVTLSYLASTSKPAVPWRVLIIDNHSDDKTGETARSFAEQLPLDVLPENRRGKSHALNTALAEISPTELVLFLDDDISVPTDWMEKFWEAHTSYPDFYLGGAVDSQFLGERPPEDLLRLSPFSISGFRPMATSGIYDRTFPGANWACPARMLIDVGGFNAALGVGNYKNLVQLTGEEAEIQQRLREAGTSGYYCDDVQVNHRIEPEKSTPNAIGTRMTSIAFTTDLERFAYWSTWRILKRLTRLSTTMMRCLVFGYRQKLCGQDTWSSYALRKRNAGSAKAAFATLKDRLAYLVRLPSKSDSATRDDRR